MDSGEVRRHGPLLWICRGICAGTPIDSRDAFPLASSLLRVMSDSAEVDLTTGLGRAGREERTCKGNSSLCSAD